MYFVIFSYRSVDRHPVPLIKPKYSHYISYIYKRKICQFINYLLKIINGLETFFSQILIPKLGRWLIWNCFRIELETVPQNCH